MLDNGEQARVASNAAVGGMGHILLYLYTYLQLFSLKPAAQRRRSTASHTPPILSNISLLPTAFSTPS